MDPWQMGLCLLLVQTSRSLSADIRDAGSDVFELPRLIGNPAAKFIVVLLLGLGIWVMPAFAGFHWMPRAILFLQVLLLVCLPCSRYYEAHMGFVLMFVCAKGSAYFALVGADATAGVLAILQILLLTTYWRVPRSANRAFRNRLERGVALVTPRRPGTAEDEREPQREEARS